MDSCNLTVAYYKVLSNLTPFVSVCVSLHLSILLYTAIYLHSAIPVGACVSLCNSFCFIFCVYIYQCFPIPLQFDRARRKAELNDKLSSLKFMLSEASLQLLPEYQHRVDVRDGFALHTYIILQQTSTSVHVCVCLCTVTHVVVL